MQMKPSFPTDLASTEQLKEAWLRSAPIEFGDPVLARTELQYQKTYFPLGFPVALATNSSKVLEVADESWGTFTSLFDTEPISISVNVSAGDSVICPPTPIFRMRGHLAANIADGENFVISDFLLGDATAWATDAALRHPSYFRNVFLESAALSNISTRYATGIHAGCVALHGIGVLLCGDSGAGKSTLSYGCALAGWTYVTDDGSYLVLGRRDRLVVGNHSQVRFRPTAETLFPELLNRPVMQRMGIGKPSIELPTTNPNGMISSARTANIKHIVFLKRGVPHQELAAFPKAVARLYMQQRVKCMPIHEGIHMEGVDHLLELGAHELRYNDLDWAIERLVSLIHEGR